MSQKKENLSDRVEEVQDAAKKVDVKWWAKTVATFVIIVGGAIGTYSFWPSSAGKPCTCSECKDSCKCCPNCPCQKKPADGNKPPCCRKGQ